MKIVKTKSGKVVGIIERREGDRLLCDDGWVYDEVDLATPTDEEIENKKKQDTERLNLLRQFIEREN